MARCSVYSITHNGLPGMQCINEADELSLDSDLIEEVNDYWNGRDIFLKMLGSDICNNHLETVEDI